MSWKLELGPAPQGLNVKRKKSWWRTMTTIEPFRAAGFCAAPPPAPIGPVIDRARLTRGPPSR